MKEVKKILLSGFIAGAVFTVNAQTEQNGEAINQSEVPEEVVKSFYEEFASAEDAEWEKEGNEYVADFTVEDEDKEAYFDSSGELAKVETTIMQEDLPDAVQNTLKKEYAGYEYKDFSRIEKEGKTKYKVEVEKEGKSEDLMFDSSGKKITSEKGTEGKNKMKSNKK